MEQEKKEEQSNTYEATINVKPASIDKDVLDVMKQEDILYAISDEVQIKRVMLNYFCEFLSEIKDLHKDIDTLMETLSVCASDKLVEFFKEVQKNTENEVARANLKEKMSKSHKKSQKNEKKSQKSKK